MGAYVPFCGSRSKCTHSCLIFSSLINLLGTFGAFGAAGAFGAGLGPRSMSVTVGIVSSKLLPGTGSHDLGGYRIAMTPLKTVLEHQYQPTITSDWQQ